MLPSLKFLYLHKLHLTMKQFFKFFFASCLSLIVGFILLIAVGMLVIGSVASSSSDEAGVDVKENSILYINLNHGVVDHVASDGFPFSSANNIGLDEILRALKNAETDDNIKGIFMELGNVGAGMATVEELRNALIDFKKSGKFIMSYSDSYSQGGYYLASVSDKIYVNPMGGIDFKGMAAKLIFIKGTLEKIGVEPQVIRHGKFKSAIEPLINDKMSEANRLQTRTYVGSLWNKVLDGIAQSRKISKQELQLIADSLYGIDPALAVKYKLADATKYRDEVLEELKTKTEAEDINEINFISLAKYVKVEFDEKNTDRSNKVAVIFAEGDIVDGKGDDSNIGGTTLSRRIRDARLDPKIKAIVLRVNSPGGSALASDIIWREVVLAKKAKPVIVSMGDVAASGGYYISCAADSIVAQPNTITGSIGVFGVLPNAKGMLEKIGVTTDTVKFGKYADLGDAARPLTQGERAIIQKEIEKIYDVFIGRVAEGRKMTKADVDSLGQGRVWSGIDAKGKGLVDKMGGLQDAIDIAVKKAKLDKYSIVYLPHPEKGLNKFMKELSGESDDNVQTVIKKELGDDYKYYQYLQKARNIKGIQARMPYEIEFN